MDLIPSFFFDVSSYHFYCPLLTPDYVALSTGKREAQHNGALQIVFLQQLLVVFGENIFSFAQYPSYC